MVSHYLVGPLHNRVMGKEGRVRLIKSAVEAFVLLNYKND